MEDFAALSPWELSAAHCHSEPLLPLRRPEGSGGAAQLTQVLESLLQKAQGRAPAPAAAGCETPRESDGLCATPGVSTTRVSSCRAKACGTASASPAAESPPLGLTLPHQPRSHKVQPLTESRPEHHQQQAKRDGPSESSSRVQRKSPPACQRTLPVASELLPRTSSRELAAHPESPVLVLPPSRQPQVLRTIVAQEQTQHEEESQGSQKAQSDKEHSDNIHDVRKESQTTSSRMAKPMPNQCLLFVNSPAQPSTKLGRHLIGKVQPLKNSRLPPAQTRGTLSLSQTLVVARHKQQHLTRQNHQEPLHSNKPQQKAFVHPRGPPQEFALTKSADSRRRKLPRPVSAPHDFQGKNTATAVTTAVVGRLGRSTKYPARFRTDEGNASFHRVEATKRVFSSPAVSPERAAPPVESTDAASKQQCPASDEQRRAAGRQSSTVSPNAAAADSLSSPSSNWSGSVSSGEVIVTPLTKRQFVCMNPAVWSLEGPPATNSLLKKPEGLNNPATPGAPSTHLMQSNAGPLGCRALIPVNRSGSVTGMFKETHPFSL
ncbi:uncharacterized protein LOC113147294 [Cyclospora cayetanensis]|uniref:Uncharacterized protein LOC113147294 n=1 Tax=Cyclospora cayetanensis TaxID=88456 RepID=A0A6P6RZ94_9EIME|nr:uncharacterized protein LOC113147294 [Cyclospora cayetanensis]